MEWLIEDALPPALLRAALAPKISAVAPHLLAALQHGEPARTAVPPTDTLCTPAQAWLIQRAGFTPSASLPLGSAWPAYCTPGAPAGQAIWWAQACHLSVSQHGVSLMEPELLAINPDEAQSLLEAIAADLSAAGVQVASTESTGCWRWQLPATWSLQAATLECMAGHEIHTGWSQDEASRPWRRLLNLIQMVWYEHPVNQARRADGRAEINSIWLQGGAQADQLPQLAEAQAVQRIQDLSTYSREGDWEAWLQALARLDQQYLQAVATAQGPQRLILTGQTSYLSLQPKPPSWFRRWFSRRQVDWQALLFEELSDTP